MLARPWRLAPTMAEIEQGRSVGGEASLMHAAGLMKREKGKGRESGTNEGFAGACPRAQSFFQECLMAQFNFSIARVSPFHPPPRVKGSRTNRGSPCPSRANAVVPFLVRVYMMRVRMNGCLFYAVLGKKGCTKSAVMWLSSRHHRRRRVSRDCGASVSSVAVRFRERPPPLLVRSLLLAAALESASSA